MIKRKLSNVWKTLTRPERKASPEATPSTAKTSGVQTSPIPSRNQSNNNNSAPQESPRVIYADTVEQLPEDIKLKIEKSGLPEKDLNEHFPILANILRFTMKKQVRYNKEKWGEKDSPASAQTRSRDTSQLPESFQGAAQATTFTTSPKAEYKKHKFIGKGGFGQVWLAIPLKNNPKSESESNDDEPSSSPKKAREKYLVLKKMNNATKKEKRMNTDEVNVLSKLKGHPNIVDYVCCFTWADEIAVIMEYIEGGSLSQAVKKYDLSEDSISYIAGEMLKGIGHLHLHGVIHRDIKSANVMLAYTGDVKLIDFGLSCAEEKASTHMVGSPFWMSPEMILSKRHSYSADIWSFGVCLIEMRDKKPPDRNSRIRCLFHYATVGVAPVIEKRLKQKKISAEFFNFIALCCKIEPTDRPTAKQLLHEPFLKSKFDKTAMQTLVKEIFENNSATEESEE